MSTACSQIGGNYAGTACSAATTFPAGDRFGIPGAGRFSGSRLRDRASERAKAAQAA